MRHSLLFPSFVMLACVLLPTVAKGQTSAEIGFFNGDNYKSSTYVGEDAFINTGDPRNSGINSTVTNSTDPSGQGGNAIIVTPISDPVIRFNNILITNGTSGTLRSITLRLPQFGLSDPRRTQLGFIDDESAFGFDDSSNPFFVRFLDPIGNYDGDYLPYAGLPLYSTLHFYQGQGNASLDALAGGRFSFSAAYPNTAGALSFLGDTAGGDSGGSLPNQTQFNTPSNPGGGILALGTAPEASCLALIAVGLLPFARVLRRRTPQ